MLTCGLLVDWLAINCIFCISFDTIHTLQNLKMIKHDSFSHSVVRRACLKYSQGVGLETLFQSLKFHCVSLRGLFVLQSLFMWVVNQTSRKLCPYFLQRYFVLKRIKDDLGQHVLIVLAVTHWAFKKEYRNLTKYKPETVFQYFSQY